MLFCFPGLWKCFFKVVTDIVVLVQVSVWPSELKDPVTLESRTDAYGRKVLFMHRVADNFFST